MEPKDPTGPPELPKSVKLPVVPTGPDVPEEPQKPQYVGKWDDIPDDGEEEEDRLNAHVKDPGDPDGVVADQEARKDREVRDQATFASIPMLPKHKHKRWPAVILTIVAIAAATYGAYWFGSSKANTSSDNKNAQTTADTQSQNSGQTAKTQTKHYDSVTYTLGIDYPDNWIVSDTASKLTVTSPNMKMSSTTGQVNAHVMMTIQNPQTSIPGFPSGGAMANLSSDKLTYKQPSSVQRAQTYLSFLGYKNPNGVDALFLTGDNGYQSGQQVPMSDVVKGNPLVSVTFVKCEDTSCVNGTPVPITLLASSWKDASFKSDVIDLLQSLTLN